MKKILTSAMMVALALSASAGEYVVYNNGTLAEGLGAQHWWNATYAFDTADPTDASVKTFSVAPSDNGADASMGILSNSQTVNGPLHSATLSYSVYAEGTCELIIRLTAIPAKGAAVEENYTIAITEDNHNQWINESLNVAEKFPQVAKNWNEGGAGGYVFGVVLTKASNAKVYFKDIKYTNTDDTWEAPAVVELPKPATVPVPETPAADVISVFGDAYTAATTFDIGSWGQSTQAAEVTIDGKKVYELKNFNYLGWQLATHLNVSEMKYMHVDYWTPDGTTFGFTPISPNQEKGWNATTVNKEEWNSYDVPLSFFSNVNFEDIYQIKFDNGGGATGYIANVYFYKDNNDTPVDPVDPVDPTNPTTFDGTVTGTASQIIEGTTTDYPYTLKYTIVYNTDKTLTITPVIEWAENKAPVGLEPWMNVYVNDGNGEIENAMAAGATTVTTTKTYNSGDALTLRFFKPYAYGGIFNQTINYTVGTVSGVESIIEDAGEAVYYDLRGVRVANPEHGIFIRVQGNKATKIVR